MTDYKRVKLTSAAAADGYARATGPQLDLSELWLVDRAVVSCTSGTATELRLYESQESPAALLSGTPLGNFDEAEYPGGMLVESGRELVAVWSNATAGAVGTLNLQVRVMRPAG